MVRQGDLLIIRVDKIPIAAIAKNSRILSEGEITGHMHELDSGIVYEYAGTLYFKVNMSETTILRHPEHGPQQFETGIYKVINQREYIPHGWRRVKD